MKRPTNLKVGDMFRVIKGNVCFDIGDIITLEQDDDIDYPYFWKQGGFEAYTIDFSYLEPYTKTIRGAQVGDVVVDEDGEESMVLERLQNTVVLSYDNNFKKASEIFTFDELEEYFTLKAEPVVDDKSKMRILDDKGKEHKEGEIFESETIEIEI